MEALLEVLKYVLPSLVVFATAFLLIKSFFEDNIRQKEMEIKMIQKKDLTPLRLQAYERIVLFLERISPHSLLPRTNQYELTAGNFQSILLSQIRSEFEHNLSQQIYISKEAWMVTKSAKESVVKIINQASEYVAPDAPAFELSRTILEHMIKHAASPTETAIDFLKKEVDSYF
jgi:hypothetical protein